MRLGIVFRLLGVIVLAGVIAVEGSAVKNRAFEGKSEHYTVVLASSADPNAVASNYAKHGVKVEQVINTASTKAYVANMPSGEANTVRLDPQVSYIEMDSQRTIHHTWWDTTLITLGLQTPHLS